VSAIRKSENSPAGSRPFARRRTQHKGFAAGGRGKAKKHFDGRALARAVGAEESENLASAHRQSQVANRDFVSENLVQVSCLDREIILLGQSQLLFNFL